MLSSIGTINVLATVAVGLAVAGGVGTTVTQVLCLLGSAAVDLVLFAASFRLLTTAHVTARQVLPGALLATSCWLALQPLGGVYVTKVLAGSSQTYGGFAAVVGLLSWLLLDADKQALRDSAHAAQLDSRQHIAVSFGQRAGQPEGREAGEE